MALCALPHAGCAGVESLQIRKTHHSHPRLRVSPRSCQDLIAPLIHLLRTAAGFHVARGKNRFAEGYDASDSAGYRDFQLLLRTPDGWLVELQVIPAQMHQLKERLGHTDYTKFRFIIEAGKRIRAQQQQPNAADSEPKAKDKRPRRGKQASVYLGFGDAGTGADATHAHTTNDTAV